MDETRWGLLIGFWTVVFGLMWLITGPLGVGVGDSNPCRNMTMAQCAQPEPEHDGPFSANP